MIDFFRTMIKSSIWAYPVISIIIVSSLYYLFIFIKSNKVEWSRVRSEKQALEFGIEAKAIVISSSLTPDLANRLIDGKKSIDIELEVFPKNKTPFMSGKIKFLANPLALDDYRIGSEIKVKYIKEHEVNIAIYQK